MTTRLAAASLLTVSLILVSGAVQARTWNIANDGTGDAPTIQAGIDSSAVGDTVLVGPGTYNEVIDFLGKDIVVKSSAGPDLTIIDGSSSSSDMVVFFHSGESRAAVLEGFKVTGGGFGIAISEAEPSIVANIVTNNLGSGNIGSAIIMAASSNLGPWSPLIMENTVSENGTPMTSSGIGSFEGMIPEIRDNYIARNHAGTGDGGGIWIRADYDGTIISHNVIEDNVAGDHGGGIYFGGLRGLTPQAEISYNVLVNNTAEGQELQETAAAAFGYRQLMPISITTRLSKILEMVHIIYLEAASHVADVPARQSSSRTSSLTRLDGAGIRCDDPATPMIRNNLAWDNVGGNGAGDCA